MFHTYFLGSSEGLLFDVSRDDLGTRSGRRKGGGPRGKPESMAAVQLCSGLCVAGEESCPWQSLPFSSQPTHV
jgi:hypothetical protein